MHLNKIVSFCLLLMLSSKLMAQINPGNYFSQVDNIHHELKITEDYVIHTTYETNPDRFIKTVGGYYKINNSQLNVDLEFNSEFAVDSVSTVQIPFKLKKETLIFNTTPKLVFTKAKEAKQDLDGQWLFATRGPDEGQKRRGEANTRKTLKFLQDGRFQWIAYDTESMSFKGCGGGSYTSIEGIYTENIEYFSRDNSRVGASLKFNYETKKDDWHHTGKNSKGKPMYEIWARR